MSDIPPIDPSALNNGKLPEHVPSPDERARMVEDATKHLHDKYPDRPPDDIQIVIDRAKLIHRDIIATLRQVHQEAVRAGLWKGPDELFPLCLKLHLEKFNAFTKEELLHLNAVWHTELALGVIQRQS